MEEQVKTPEPTFADIKVMLSNGGVLPEKATQAVEEAVPETPAAEATAETPEAEATPATEPEAVSEPVRDDKGKFAKKEDLPAGVQKRIAKEIAKATEARREAERLREEARAEREQVSRPAKETAPVKTPPKIEDFNTYDEYTDARARWAAAAEVEAVLNAERARLEQERATQHQVSLKDAWTEAEASARKSLPDYDEVVSEIDWPQTPAIQAVSDYVVQAKNPALLYMLQKNPDAVEKIAKLPPVLAIAEIGKLEAKFESQTNPVKTTAAVAKRALPKPPSTVGGATGSKMLSLNEVAEQKGPQSMVEFKRLWAQQHGKKTS